MADRSTYTLVAEAAAEYLKNHKKLSSKSPAPSKEVVDHIVDLKLSGNLDISVTPSTILQYISYAANNDPSYGIRSGGAWGGYWFEEPDKSAENIKKFDTAKIKDHDGKAVTFAERDLYPLVELWLSSIKGYVAKNVSTVKAGRKWGNPDIVGVNFVEMFQSIEIEMASVEVKLSDDNWEQFIFEAISHKRFSNRSWYCYRVSEERPMPKGMAYYAERYRVGVVQIVLTDDDMASLKANPSDPISLIDRVHELVLAIYDPVPLQEKKDLIDRTGISLKPTFG